MYKIFKYEMKYLRIGITAILFMPIIYTVNVLLGEPVGENPEGHLRVLFPIIFGAFPVWIWAVIVIKKIRKNADYIYQTLPVNLKVVSINRFLILTFPLMLIFIYYLVIHVTVLTGWHSITERIVFMSGTHILIISVLYLSFELAIVMNREWQKVTVSWSTVAAAIVLMVIIDFSAFAQSHKLTLGFIYMAAGFAAVALGCIVYRKRKSYIVKEE